ncbi:unnamed protein product, partial [Allacma fusca]
LFQNCSIG